MAGKTPRGYLMNGDDVALIPAGRGKLVVKVDMLVEHTDVPLGMSYRQAARKAVAMCVSDFAAKGARPDSFMISLGLKKGVTQEQVDELGLGFSDAERKWGVHLVGGDTNEAMELIVDCAMVGFAERVVSRGGASPGDALVVTGRFGLQPAGLKILSGETVADQGFGERAKRSVLNPTPDLAVGLALGPYLSSAMDSSDGLARSLHSLAKESRVGFEVTGLPMANGVEKFAMKNGLSAEDLVLNGGEEYVVVGTVKRSRLKAARSAAVRAGGDLLQIGEATASKRVVLRRDGKAEPIRDSGWTHLSGR